MNFEWLAGVDPIWGVAITLLAYAALLVWSLTRTRQQVMRGAPDSARWRDLRLWIVPMILVQMWLYWSLR